MQMSKTSILLNSAAAAVLLATCMSCAAAPTYRIELVAKSNSILPWSVRAISDIGNIAGYGRISGTHSVQAFFADPSREVRPLEQAVNSFTWTYDVNNEGSVTGYYNRTDGFGASTAMWRADGSLVDLQQLAGCDMGPGAGFASDAYLNDAGDLTFYLECQLGNQAVKTSVLWHQDTVTVIPGFDGGRSYAKAINKSMQIAGDSEFPPDSDGHRRTLAFRWSDGVMSSLGTLGGPTSSATAMNDHGHVAGTSSLADGRTRTFVYDDAGMRAMPLCEGKSPVRPVGITNAGMVVGTYGSDKNRRTGLIRKGRCDSLATLLDSSGLDWTNLQAHAVNNQGVIVGDGSFQGSTRAFIATPLR
jgi:probable HAF family extracellular repeat protein